MELTKEYIREQITTNDQWACHAIAALYRYQTADEQLDEATKHQNSVGFNGVDAPFLSSLARQLAEGRALSWKQLKVAKRLLGKYAGQLLKIAEMEKESK